jgi:hypothetical protein
MPADLSCRLHGELRNWLEVWKISRWTVAVKDITGNVAVA